MGYQYINGYNDEGLGKTPYKFHSIKRQTDGYKVSKLAQVMTPHDMPNPQPRPMFPACGAAKPTALKISGLRYHYHQRRVVSQIVPSPVLTVSPYSLHSYIHVDGTHRL